MPQPSRCLICHDSGNLTACFRVSREILIAGWQREFGIDVRGELKDAPEIEMVECTRCHLQFFLPPGMAGSPALYADLATLDWYYMPDKWEYEAACQDTPRQGTILEIGCGN